MNIVLAPDSFKECLSATEVAQAMAQGILEVVPEANIKQIPISDGGEGLLDALVLPLGGTIKSTEVQDPLGRLITAEYGLLPDGKTAVIEMAKASGLELLTPAEKNPLITTTYGTGQLARAALDQGCDRFILGIGGSATNDGGVGMAQALGYRFLDGEGNELPPGGGSLGNLVTIDSSHVDPRIKNASFTVACDVSNPFIGATGASKIYGPQKGAKPDMVELLDANLQHLAETISQQLKVDIAQVPGSGAAGGLGGGLLAFFQGHLKQGIELILQTLELDKHLQNADLVFTGEGKIDGQTLYGKTIAGLGRLAQKHNVPVIAVAGKLGEGSENLAQIGVTASFSIVNGPMTLSDSMANAGPLIQKQLSQIMRCITLSIK
ncbi:glycerate kinase [Sediminicola luteus]|uniref:Glycerate kinase n=1 Tax=Sediminicola luteus TaxID=319238 RepID=A0A2A4G4L2_9FLAO|nr:glycerate kinase [Sediminicola luteus]PCE63371.1 glycerate kinase [Sediminicola luteus]